MQFVRRILSKCAIPLAGLLLVLSMQVGVASAATAVPSTSRTAAKPLVESGSFNANDAFLRQLQLEGKLSRSVNVLNSLGQTTIVQFPLVPSGVKQAFPNASGLVTIVRGDRNNAFSDTITVDVQNMPPNTTFTIFFIELANKPFGNVEYVADLTTRGDGSGETIFQCIAFVAFAMDARNPGTSVDGQEGVTSGINLEHMGMWFSSLQDAQKVLNNPSLTGTIFDAGNPPLHAGPQAMTDGQTLPVF
ncbi:MAG TPA: hypothetical protein VFQ36_20775 [Ktedonobacteraceae bacterium]|nr:hypothetical protein [Ktedonobacteraceae bacterium]